MNDIYLAKHVSIDYDQLNHIVVVAKNEAKAADLCFIEYGTMYGIESFLKNYSIEKIGVTDKPCGTLILRDY